MNISDISLGVALAIYTEEFLNEIIPIDKNSSEINKNNKLMFLVCGSIFSAGLAHICKYVYNYHIKYFIYTKRSKKLKNKEYIKFISNILTKILMDLMEYIVSYMISRHTQIILDEVIPINKNIVEKKTSHLFVYIFSSIFSTGLAHLYKYVYIRYLNRTKKKNFIESKLF
jgi:hypothetical protein